MGASIFRQSVVNRSSMSGECTEPLCNRQPFPCDTENRYQQSHLCCKLPASELRSIAVRLETGTQAGPLRRDYLRSHLKSFRSMGKPARPPFPATVFRSQRAGFFRQRLRARRSCCIHFQSLLHTRFDVHDFEILTNRRPHDDSVC